MKENEEKIETKIGKGFLEYALIYFLLGAIWMGLEEFIPKPHSSTALVFYDLARDHVMVLGWVSFAIIGLIYSAFPTVFGRKLFSQKLSKAHFWVTTIAFPLSVVMLTISSFEIDPFLTSGMTTNQALLQLSVATFFFSYFSCVVLGIGFQFVFVYNIFRTFETKRLTNYQQS